MIRSHVIVGGAAVVAGRDEVGGVRDPVLVVDGPLGFALFLAVALCNAAIISAAVPPTPLSEVVAYVWRLFLAVRTMSAGTRGGKKGTRRSLASAIHVV